MSLRVPVAVAALCSVPLFAQQTFINVTAATPIALRTDVGGQISLTTIAPGTTQAVLTAAHYSGPTQSGTAAAVHYDWVATASSQRVQLVLAQTIEVLGNSVPASGAVDMSDLLVTMQSTSPVAADLELGLTVVASQPGASLSWGVDVGDDGTFEATESSISPVVLHSITLGAPLPIRIRLAASQTGPGTFTIDTRIIARPANNLTILPAVPGCGSTGLYVVPSFYLGGIELFADSVFPVAAVLGLGTQPVVLPAQFPACLLLPSPDYIALLQPFVSLQLPLPPTVRPVTIWMQGVDFVGQLATTGSFAVLAN